MEKADRTLGSGNGKSCRESSCMRTDTHTTRTDDHFLNRHSKDLLLLPLAVIFAGRTQGPRATNVKLGCTYRCTLWFVPVTVNSRATTPRAREPRVKLKHIAPVCGMHHGSLVLQRRLKVIHWPNLPHTDLAHGITKRARAGGRRSSNTHSICRVAAHSS